MAEFTTETQPRTTGRTEVHAPAAGGTEARARSAGGTDVFAQASGETDVRAQLSEGTGVPAQAPGATGGQARDSGGAGEQARSVGGAGEQARDSGGAREQARSVGGAGEQARDSGGTREQTRTAGGTREQARTVGGAGEQAPATDARPLDGHEAGVILERARASVDPALRSALESLPGSLRRIALYHFGWEHADGTPAAGNAGKAIRPALVLTAAAALGGPPAHAAAVRAATAVELVHNFTLLHDDVMDRDTTRRHRPTDWTVFGEADAILAGDALHALALKLLAEDPHPAAGAAASRLATCVVELCEGQHEDTAMEGLGPDEVTLDQVLVMAEAKTGALLGCACALGALYAGASVEDVEAMDAFGREAGLAFQLIDDVIGIWGDPSRTGKPAGADLAARKKSLPVVAALASGTPAAAELAALYTAPYDGEDLARTALAVEEAGGRDWAQVQAADRMARAVQQLARAVPEPEAAGGLLSLAEFVTRRSA